MSHFDNICIRNHWFRVFIVSIIACVGLLTAARKVKNPSVEYRNPLFVENNVGKDFGYTMYPWTFYGICDEDDPELVRKIRKEIRYNELYFGTPMRINLRGVDQRFYSCTMFEPIVLAYNHCVLNLRIVRNPGRIRLKEYFAYENGKFTSFQVANNVRNKFVKWNPSDFSYTLSIPENKTDKMRAWILHYQSIIKDRRSSTDPGVKDSTYTCRQIIFMQMPKMDSISDSYIVDSTIKLDQELRKNKIPWN